jgi:hypothetical protein
METPNEVIDAINSTVDPSKIVYRIARRGRGAEGSAECNLLGKVTKLNEDGIVENVEYDDINLSESEMKAYAESKGVNLLSALALGIDALVKKAALAGSNAKSLLQAELIAANLCDAKKASALASSVILIAQVQGVTTSDVIAGMVAVKAQKK